MGTGVLEVLRFGQVAQGFGEGEMYFFGSHGFFAQGSSKMVDQPLDGRLYN